MVSWRKNPKSSASGSWLTNTEGIFEGSVPVFHLEELNHPCVGLWKDDFLE